MQEENRENTTIEKTAEALGLFSALLVFSTVVYFIWNFLGRLHEGIAYWHVLVGAFIIYLSGLLIRKFFHE